MKLRPYQERAIASLYNFLRERPGKHPVLVIPTGGGKTVVMAQIIRDAMRWSSRVAIVAHRRELLQQSHDTLFEMSPGLEIGVYSAGMGRREIEAPVLLCGIQSVYGRAFELGRFDLILVDEAHRIPVDGEGMYRTFVREAKKVNPRVRLVGLTATPYRMRTGHIYGRGRIFDELCFDASIRELIVDGFLCELTTRTGKADSIADTSGVQVRGGEFVESQLERAMAIPAVVQSAVTEILEHTRERRKCLVFTCGVDHGCMVRDEINRQLGNQVMSGDRAELVTGETPKSVRDETLRDFREGSLKFLVNVNVLTEGFDAPNIDAIALLRATQSPGLYYQMCGRGFRPHPGKESCIVLDFGENVFRHGLVDRIKPKVAVEGGGEAPVKECPECHAVVSMSYKTCPECSYAFPPPEDGPRHEGRSADGAILSHQIKAEWHRVRSVWYSAHEKRGAPENHPRTLRVEYEIGFYRYVSEWICVEHPEGSFANEKARFWWQKRSTYKTFPKSAEEAAQIGKAGWIVEPDEVLIREEPKRWPEIIRMRLRRAPPRILQAQMSPEEIDNLNAQEVEYEEGEVPF